MGRLSWVLQVGPKFHHLCPCEEGDSGRVATDRGGGGVTTEAELRLMWPQAKGCWRPPEAAGGKEWVLLSRLQTEHGPVDRLISTQ